jgi:hypothetical protein
MPETLKSQLEAISKLDRKIGNVIIPARREGRCACHRWTKKQMEVNLYSPQTTNDLFKIVQERRMLLDHRAGANSIAPAYTDIILAFLVGALGIASTIIDANNKNTGKNEFQTSKLAISATITALGLSYALIKAVTETINKRDTPLRDELAEAETWLNQYMLSRFSAMGRAAAGRSLTDSVDKTINEAAESLDKAIVLVANNPPAKVPYAHAPQVGGAVVALTDVSKPIVAAVLHRAGARLLAEPQPNVAANHATILMNCRP